MVDQTQEINKKESWEYVTAAPNANVTQQLPLDMTFHEGHVVSIVTYSILMVVSGVANLTVLVLLLKKRGKSKSMINTMFLNLAIADLLVTFLMMPLEIGWNFTVSWKAGDAMCRIMAFFRIFGLYLSGFVIMCISIDRYYAVLKPFCQCSVKARGKIMLATAWIASTICSVPQIAIFHVESHPNFTDYQQCVTFNFFKSEYHDLAYKYFGLVMMYGLPLCVIVFCYSSILCEIYKRYKDCYSGPDPFRRPSAGFLGRARIRTLKLTVTIVTVFIVCWTPYYVMSLWHWIDKESAQKVDPRIQKALFIFACGNSIMNPVVYGFFNVRTAPPETDQQTIISRRGKLSVIPDVINGDPNSGRTSKSKMLWQQKLSSFSFDKTEIDSAACAKETEVSIKDDSKRKRFRWRLHTQRSFSSEGTDFADTAAIDAMERNQKDPDIRIQRWRQGRQRSQLSNGGQEGETTGSGWRSWLSHNRYVNQNETNEERNQPKQSAWTKWIFKKRLTLESKMDEELTLERTDKFTSKQEEKE